MIINEVAPDWLTLTTFDEIPAYALQQIIDRHSTGPLEDQKRMQYSGFRKGQLFLGRSLQLGLPHYMFQASGLGAALTWVDCAEIALLKCTRIDLQLTIPMPKWYSSRDFYDALAAHPKLPDVSIVQSGDGLDTIYVHRRISRRFWRVYAKLDAAGRKWLRFEVEFKRELAAAVWEQLRDSDDSYRLMAELVAAELDSCPVKGPEFNAFLAVIEDARGGKRASDNRVAGSGRTLNWLMKQVNGAVMRAMHDHDEGEGVRDLIRVWAAWAERIENDDEADYNDA